MIIIIAPGLIVVCVLVVALVALSHLTAGALVAMVAIVAVAAVLTALAITYMHGRMARVLEPPRSRLSARVLERDHAFMELPPQPVWTAEPILATGEEPTREQLEAAARYILRMYGDAGRVADLEALEPRREDTHD